MIGNVMYISVRSHDPDVIVSELKMGKMTTTRVYPERSRINLNIDSYV